MSSKCGSFKQTNRHEMEVGQNQLQLDKTPIPQKNITTTMRRVVSLRHLPKTCCDPHPSRNCLAKVFRCQSLASAPRRSFSRAWCSAFVCLSYTRVQIYIQMYINKGMCYMDTAYSLESQEIHVRRVHCMFMFINFLICSVPFYKRQSDAALVAPSGEHVNSLSSTPLPQTATAMQKQSCCSTAMAGRCHSFRRKRSRR